MDCSTILKNSTEEEGNFGGADEHLILRTLNGMSTYYFQWINTDLEHKNEIWAGCEDLRSIEDDRSHCG